MKWLFLSPIPKLFDKVIILRATPCCVFGRDADGWGVPARPFVTHLALLSLPFVLCLGRSPHCVHWRARSKELPPEEAPQTQVQPQGETGADGAQFRGSQVRRWRIQCKHPQTSEWVRLHQRIVCVCVCVYLRVGGWVYSKQPVNHSLQDIRVSFVEEAKRSCESWVGWWKKKTEKISLNWIPGRGWLERGLQTMLGSLEVASDSSGWKKRNSKKNQGCSTIEHSRCLQGSFLLQESTRCRVA